MAQKKVQRCTKLQIKKSERLCFANAQPKKKSKQAQAAAAYKKKPKNESNENLNQYKNKKIYRLKKIQVS